MLLKLTGIKFYSYQIYLGCELGDIILKRFEFARYELLFYYSVTLSHFQCAVMCIRLLYIDQPSDDNLYDQTKRCYWF